MTIGPDGGEARARAQLRPRGPSRRRGAYTHTVLYMDCYMYLNTNTAYTHNYTYTDLYMDCCVYLNTNQYILIYV